MTLRDSEFYVDESIYSKLLVAELRRAGEIVHHVGVDVPFGADDQEWLAAVGAHQWIAITRDQRIRYRKLEKEALKAAGVGAFTFTGGQATALETATAILSRLEKMRAIARSEPRPFLYTFGLYGPLSRVTL